MADRATRRTGPWRLVALALTLIGCPGAATPLVESTPACNDDGSVNVLVEIPAGTLDKWQVDKVTGELVWELEDGRPRVVRYLPYPGNYGMIPRTLLPRQLGGDGDPLDVIVLGPAVPRGALIRARLIGVLRLLDRGERDDKLLAVSAAGPFFDVADLAALDERFPGVSQIIAIWFGHYKGPGQLVTEGFGDATEARRVLEAAKAAHEPR